MCNSLLLQFNQVSPIQLSRQKCYLRRAQDTFHKILNDQQVANKKELSFNQDKEISEQKTASQFVQFQISFKVNSRMNKEMLQSEMMFQTANRIQAINSHQN